MTKIIRLYTEDITNKRAKLINCVLRHFPEGASIFYGRGIYKTKDGETIREKSTMIEIITAQMFNWREPVERLAKDIKILNNQESVLVVEIEVPNNQVRFI